jgi:hypothetical protein
MVSTFRYVLLLTLNKAFPRGSPRFTNPILMLISPLIWLDVVFMLPLSMLVCSSLSVWLTYIHRPFKLSMVLRLKYLLQSN